MRDADESVGVGALSPLPKLNKIGDFMKFKGSCAEIPREQLCCAPEKTKTLKKIAREKRTFETLAFYKAPILHIVDSFLFLSE